MIDNLNFGDAITEIRISQGLNLRKISKNLPNVTISKYSKIERGVQNPKNKQEFKEIIKALNIKDPEIISLLELKAMVFIQPKKLSDEDFLEYLPAFLPKKFKSKKELNDFIKKYRKIIEESISPE